MFESRWGYLRRPISDHTRPSWVFCIQQGSESVIEGAHGVSSAHSRSLKARDQGVIEFWVYHPLRDHLNVSTS